MKLGNLFILAASMLVTFISISGTVHGEPAHGYKDVYYGITAPTGVERIVVEVKLRYRQADQKIAESLLAAVPQSINLKTVYGLEKTPTLPIVDMVTKQTTVPAKK